MLKILNRSNKTLFEYSGLLRDADLSDADLSGANLRDADLIGANLRGTNLSGTNLSGTNLSGANLSDANLRGANLRDAGLSGAGLSGAGLSGANLRGANLLDADLSGANLRDADLRDANLRGTDLRGADLRGTNLSGVKGLLLAATWLARYFKSDKYGYIVYKKQQGNYTSPSNWSFNPGKILNEVPSPSRVNDCACGINFATCKWINDMYGINASPIWKCRIAWKDLTDVVVPYNTDGKARCARLELIEIVKL